MAHWMLCRRHARWRLILWRSILCFGLVLPLLHFFQVPGLKIPITSEAASTTEFAGSISPVAAVNPTRPAASVAQPLPASVAASPTSNSANSLQSLPPPKPVSWESILMVIWTVGSVCGAIRLVRLHLQLARLRKETCQSAPDLQRLAKQIQIRLHVRRKVDIQISDAVTSPFVCGLLKPTIILPRTLAQHLSPGEAAALLSHEVAHLRQNDLVWCVAWRWIKAVCWFHPLVWKVPAVHNLACEQEADRIASGQLADQDSYAQLLARLALQVLGLPAVETKLTLNGSSQIARRLNHLNQEEVGSWNWRHSVMGFGLVGLLFLMSAGCEFSKTSPARSKISTTIEFKEVLVVVEDEDGKPIEGATIQPDGLRVKGNRASHYSWNPKSHGVPSNVTTDREGKAYVKYPVEAFPEEKLLTVEISFSVVHPDFSRARPTEYPVDGTAKPIQLTRGIRLEVSGYFGNDRRPVIELVPNVSEGLRPEDWLKKADGVFAFQNLSPGGHLLQLMGRLPSGQIVYSESLAFTAERGKPCNFALEMKSGIRLEGHIDDKVPRPVKNGRVLISVRPKEFPAWLVPEDMDDVWKKYGYFYFWKSYRPIAKDGTFVFESIPPGEVDVVVHGDGFISQNGGQPKNRINSQLVTGLVIGVPQPFSLGAPVTKIEVVTEPTATLEVTTKTKSGKPVVGATAYVSPNILRMGGIFGWMKHSSEEPFRTLSPLPELPYSGKTDKNGAVAIRNLPAFARHLDIEHPQFEVPVDSMWDRNIRLKLSPGITNKLELTLQPKGKDFIGSAK
jgi:beta-lactamase regulating signal transducer with metallopeptidase domain